MKEHFRYLNTFAIFAFAILLSYSYQQKPRPEESNIIVFIVNDVNWNDVGCYVKTPTIDNLASKGIKFNSFT